MIELVAFVNTTFKLGPSFWAQRHQKYCSMYLHCFYLHSKQLRGILKKKEKESLPLVFGTYLSNREQANSVSLFILSLLQCSKVAESQTEIHSCSGTSFISLLFCLTRTIFTFLCQNVCIRNFLWSKWRPVTMFYPLSTPPARCDFLGETHPLPTQKCPNLTKTSKYRQRALQTQSPQHTSRGL